VATAVGYKLIKNVPSLLHTPLMSGMIALTGVTVLGTLAATHAAARPENKVLGAVAIVLALVNIAAGFYVTGRMLNMFHRKDDAGEAGR
jgi:NAD(P) transhydrogenase subunit alpha